MCPQLDLESHLPIQVLLAQCSPQAPSGPHLWNLGSIWVLLFFQELPWGFCFPRPLLSRWSWALRAGEMGLTPGKHVAEWPFKTCLSKPHFHPYSRLSPLAPLDAETHPNIWGLETQVSGSRLKTSIRHSVSIHNMIFCISLTELCGFSFFSRIFKVDKKIFCFHFLKNIRILKWDSPGYFAIVPLLKNAHILRTVGESAFCQVGLCFPSPGPYSKMLKTSALSSD